MSETTNVLAVDLGASSGRVMLGRWDGARFSLHELHRFPNGPVPVLGHLHWDVLRLWQEITTGIARYAAQEDAPLAGIGIDTWAVDFALLDGAGRMLGNPYHYRDGRTAGMIEIVDRQVSRERLYAQTGIQRLPLNTLYQLVSMRENSDPQLDAAATFLLVPDLFHYWLTGRKVAEYTNATAQLLPEVVAPGTVLGELRPAVRAAVGLGQLVPVIAVGTHDCAAWSIPTQRTS